MGLSLRLVLPVILGIKYVDVKLIKLVKVNVEGFF